jgi:hypothetical protein
MYSLKLHRTMRVARRFGLAVLAFAFFFQSDPLARAQRAPGQAADQVATQPAAAHYWLRVTGGRVNLRSRPDANSRIVGRVERDDVLEGVGGEYGWQRVVPPAGVFSLVAAEYINRTGADRGIVSVDTSLRVRVGSDLQPRDPLLSEVQTRLQPDAEVRIIGQLDEDWLKIVPPSGVYVYISDEYVEKVSADVAATLQMARPHVESQPGETAKPIPIVELERPPTTTQPDLSGRYGKLLVEELTTLGRFEGQLAGGAPKADQKDLYPLTPGILERLRPIAEQREEPQVAQLAAAWIRRLEKWRRDQAAARAAREIAQRAELAKARHARELAEIRRAEEEQRAAEPVFDARGVMRPSFALPAGDYGLRYKLQDPFTREVKAYVEFPTELKIDVAACVGKYVGVRGERLSDRGVGAMILRVTHITVLNPDKPVEPPTRGKP